MRCRKHHSDLSSSVGVCASCLRERLFTLIAAQAQAQQQAHQTNSCVEGNYDGAGDDPLPPPHVFPRSVSPYVSRRKSDETAWNDLSRGDRRHRHHHLFYSTPQIGPTSRTGSSATSTFVTTGSFDRKQKSRFSLWSRLFRSRSEKFEKKHKNPSRESCEPASSSSSSPSWFSTIFTGRRHKQSSLVALDEPVAAAERRHCQGIKRGMSPAEMSDTDEECDGSDRSPTARGHSPEMSQKLQQSPIAVPGSTKRGRSGNRRNVSGLAFCLSPLVRASPNQNWNQKGLPPEITFSGDLRVTAKPHLCANRSRKIADFGRVNHNR